MCRDYAPRPSCATPQCTHHVTCKHTNPYCVMCYHTRIEKGTGAA